MPDLELLTTRRAELVTRLEQTTETIAAELAAPIPAPRRAELYREIAGDFEAAYCHMAQELLDGAPTFLSSLDTAHRLLRARRLELPTMATLRHRVRMARKFARENDQAAAHLGDGRAPLALLASIHAAVASTLAEEPLKEKFIAWGAEFEALGETLEPAIKAHIPSQAEVAAFLASDGERPS